MECKGDLSVGHALQIVLSIFAGEVDTGEAVGKFMLGRMVLLLGRLLGKFTLGRMILGRLLLDRLLGRWRLIMWGLGRLLWGSCSRASCSGGGLCWTGCWADCRKALDGPSKGS